MIFSWRYHFFILKKPKICMKFCKNYVSCFWEKVVLINGLTGWQRCFHKQGFPYWRMRGSPSPPPPHEIVIFKLKPTQNSIFGCSHCSCSIFVLLHTLWILRSCLILIDVQYSQKAVLAFKQVRIVKVIPPQVPFTQQKNLPGKICDSPRIEGNLPHPQPLTLFGKPW